MKLTTIRTSRGTRAARAEGDGTLVELPFADVGALLRDPHWPAAADGPVHEAMFAERSALVTRPGKVVRVGRDSVRVTRPRLLSGPRDPIVLPQETVAVWWKTELAVVIGPAGAVAGFSMLNEISEIGRLSLGPALVTPDELPGALRPRLTLCSFVDGRSVRNSAPAELDFGALVADLALRLPLDPGDVVAVARDEVPLVLNAGSVLEVEIDELGFHENALAGVRSRV
ncbi:fumarylacetoacetate hydrolase family protein [Amycolatopsis rhabdoformis]|uniref:Fumarylacetoacetate hydrolase family protein n=1 Tax=Amycolatopsis rhabdoformis TaxID=1448059 RepID=A0ABZ1I0G7_9PSEU|nr:fumarylacetoacetate hydrolase family protein [Amycolatopsis rhabdoformis]WSE27396.1 fumarylacetoacetate hydrolase family protein [Amycolatopsis rhabdoformis]